jgi:hypothetical protein
MGTSSGFFTTPASKPNLLFTSDGFGMKIFFTILINTLDGVMGDKKYIRLMVVYSLFWAHYKN